MPNDILNNPLQKTLRINEIYQSVQGESTWAGLPCTFVRLARCHLRCTWCDTEYAFHGGERWTLEAILRQVAQLPPRLVELTGGEPLVQKECPILAQALVDAGYTVLVETSGSLPIDVLPEEAIAIMDLKCPDSGECARNYWPNIDALRPDRDEVKFVLASRRDYEWSRDTIRTYTLQERCRAILMSPVFGRIEPREIVEWILADELPVRFQLQLHKFIWAPNAKGV
jgi:7-carboxy-7-deazaguanine synthase